MRWPARPSGRCGVEGIVDLDETIVDRAIASNSTWITQKPALMRSSTP
jgi:hypothetical protein